MAQPRPELTACGRVHPGTGSPLSPAPEGFLAFLKAEEPRVYFNPR